MSTNIAILDDDQVFRTFLCAVLADAGYEPVALVAGIGVHEALRDFAPAAIILDVPHDLSASALHWPALAVLAQEACPGWLAHPPVAEAPLGLRWPAMCDRLTTVRVTP